MNPVAVLGVLGRKAALALLHPNELRIAMTLKTLSSVCLLPWSLACASAPSGDVPHERTLSSGARAFALASEPMESLPVDASRNPPGGLSPQEIPQFVTLTLDDSIGPQALELYSQLAGNRHRNGCGIQATWYTSIAANPDAPPLTKCEYVQALLRGHHEIAIHTFGHSGDPGEEEILRAVDWLHTECGVPMEEMRGFRTPYLQHTQRTFDKLRELGFLYDSSITLPGVDSSQGANHLWPYTMDNGIQQNCAASAGSCDPSVSNPGLWEVPMWSLFDVNGAPLQAMDWPGNAYEILNRNLERHYNGNRAPIGIFLHAGWLQTHGGELDDWIRETLERYDDVHFITTRALIHWMQNPVPSVEYEPTCEGQVPECFPPKIALGGCGHGTFNPVTCACDCTAPFCADVNGACMTTTGCGVPESVDGGFSGWSVWSGCCDGVQARSRSCTEPAPSGGGAPCLGPATETRGCEGDLCDESPFYAHWGVGRCVRDGQEPDWELNLYPTRLACCEAQFPWDVAGCAGDIGEASVDGGWSAVSWGACSVPCGGGIRTGTRSCTNPAPLHGGADCDGAAAVSEPCNVEPCGEPVDGGWTAWAAWSGCSSSCGGGIRTRTRACESPRPSNGGAPCSGLATETQECNAEACAELFYPNWGVGSCVADGNQPAWESQLYAAKAECCHQRFPWDVTRCMGSTEPVDGGWSEWSEYGHCSVSCGGGTRSRVRACDGPAPLNGGRDCLGPAVESESCNEQACPAPVDGGWSEWSEYGACNASCGGGTQIRVRACENPAPAYGGADCTGTDSESRSCNPDPCDHPFYPNWSRSTCVSDGLQATWETNLSPTLADCCERNFAWNLSDCLAGG